MLRCILPSTPRDWHRQYVDWLHIETAYKKAETYYSRSQGQSWIHYLKKTEVLIHIYHKKGLKFPGAAQNPHRNGSCSWSRAKCRIFLRKLSLTLETIFWKPTSGLKQNHKWSSCDQDYLIIKFKLSFKFRECIFRKKTSNIGVLGHTDFYSHPSFPVFFTLLC